MLWLLVIILIGSLSIVLFHKPQVNPMGAGWTPPDKRQLALPEVSSASDNASDVLTTSEDAVTAPVPKQPQMPDTFNFNDLFGGPKSQGPTDRPNA